MRRGVIFAIAHVRGGGDLGQYWYLDGKMGNKPNTFKDTVAAATHLIQVCRRMQMQMKPASAGLLCAMYTGPLGVQSVNWEGSSRHEFTPQDACMPTSCFA